MLIIICITKPKNYYSIILVIKFKIMLQYVKIIIAKYNVLNLRIILIYGNTHMRKIHSFFRFVEESILHNTILYEVVNFDL